MVLTDFVPQITRDAIAVFVFFRCVKPIGFMLYVLGRQHSEGISRAINHSWEWQWSKDKLASPGSIQGEMNIADRRG